MNIKDWYNIENSAQDDKKLSLSDFIAEAMLLTTDDEKPLDELTERLNALLAKQGDQVVTYKELALFMLDFVFQVNQTLEYMDNLINGVNANDEETK
jgi:hypothetical protein